MGTEEEEDDDDDIRTSFFRVVEKVAEDTAEGEENMAYGTAAITDKDGGEFHNLGTAAAAPPPQG